MGTQNNKSLIRFTVNIPLKYNVSNVLHDEQDSEFVMDLTEPAEYSCAMGSSSIIRFSSWDYTKTIV